MRLRKVLALTLCTATVAGMILTGCGNKTQTSGNENTSNPEDVVENDTDQTDSGFDTSKQISVLSREDGSGTRGAFIELFGIEVKNEDGEKEDMTTVDATITNNTEVMMSTVAGNPYAIGYCSLGSLNDSVKAVQIDGVEATTDHVSDGTYQVARPFNIVTKDNMSEIAQDFINYILSTEGQTVVEDNGYIGIPDVVPFSSNGAAGKISIAGSSSVSPVMEKLKEAYLQVNPDATIEIQTSDSTTGVTSAMEGTCDIGMASRELKEEETGVTSTKIAMDGIAVIVNKENSITNLSSEQVRKIFIGETTSWAEVQ